MTHPRTFTCAVLALAATAGGCGYSFAPLYPANVTTVAVPIWNRGEGIYRRGVEVRLTEALVKQIELKTGYKVTDKQSADTELVGTIDVIEQAPPSYNPDTGRPRQQELTIRVSFTWRDLREGKILAHRENFPVTGVYFPHEPFSEIFFQGSEDVINELARRIVEQMQSSWPDGPAGR